MSIDSIIISTYTIPCDRPESDGTIEWKDTTMVAVAIHAENLTGLGYTYENAAAADVIKHNFVPLLKNSDVKNVPRIWEKMVSSVRNIGLSGLCARAISAVDIALWDLKAKLIQLPLCELWGMSKEKIPVYGSGGFTSYSNQQLADQFLSWKAKGINKFKMKIGRYPEEDLERVREAKKIIGEHSQLFVDANGAYTRKQALYFAEKFKEFGVVWFEEPVSSDDLEGLRLLRDRSPSGMNITAGEYGSNVFYFKKMLTAQAVDVLQADATRCCGFTGFFQASQLSYAFNLPLSSHTAPSVHLHACLSLPNVCHMEFFHDHARIEEKYFKGFPLLEDGCLKPYSNLSGHGLELKHEALNQFLIKEEHL